MWLLKSNVPYLRKIQVEDEKNEIILFHSDGANKFSKQDVLGWELTNDTHSVSNNEDSLKLIHYLTAFILFGGFLNMYHSIFPIFIENRIPSPLVTTHGFWLILILDLFLTIVSTFVVYMGIKFLLSIKGRINDILIINLNNQNVKIRFEGKRDHENPFNRLINFLPPKYGGWKDEEVLDENIYLSNKIFLWFLGLYVILSVILFLFYVDAPFIFLGKFQSSFLGMDVPYWEYFGTWSNGKVVYNIHPFNAFLDGLVSNFIFPVFLILISVFLFLVVILIGFFIALPFHILSLLLIYLNFNLSEKFQFFGRISGWLISIFWYPIFTLWEDELFEVKGISSLRISHSKYNLVKFVEGVILTILSLFFVFTSTASFCFWVMDIAIKIDFKLGAIFLNKQIPLITSLIIIVSGVISFFLNSILKKLLDAEQLNEIIEMSRVSKDGLLLKTSPFRYRNAKFVVIEAVKNSGLALQFATRKLKNDKEVVMTAVKNNALALQYASSNLRNDRDVVKIALQSNGLALQYASLNLSNDRKFVLSALRNNSLELEIELSGAFDGGFFGGPPYEYDKLSITPDFLLNGFFHLFPIQEPDFISHRMVFTTFNKSQYI